MEDDRITRLKSDMHADSIPAFRKAIDKIMKDEALGGIDSEHQGEIWYRGQQRKHWPLVPKIQRITQDAWWIENDVREEFSLHAASLHYGSPLPTNEWDMYFLMQHYGAPTRLLDWTESPMAALYFALRDNPGLYDSAVWVLNPLRLNKKSINDETIIAPSAVGVNPKQVEAISGWLPKLYAKTRKSSHAKYPIAVFPSDVAWRMNGQRSRFTVHGRDEYGFQNFTKGKNPLLRRIIIPARTARKMLAEVKNYGIDETVLFPDLEGLGRALTAKYSDFTQGDNNEVQAVHESVYTRLRPSKQQPGEVGVFAIRPIPKGTSIFSGEDEDRVWVDDLTSINNLKPALLTKLYNDFVRVRIDRSGNKHYGFPTSFNRLTPSWYIQESDHPNVAVDENYDFHALRNIKRNEEITVALGTLRPSSLKNTFKRKKQ